MNSFVRCLRGLRGPVVPFVSLTAVLACGGVDGSDLTDEEARSEWAEGLGASFYVSTSGSDTSGTGSASSPWRTISKAMKSVPDDSTILVRPGTYNGRVSLEGNFVHGVVVRSEVPYKAMLRHTGGVVTCYGGHGITLEGFDIAHTGPGASPLVVHIDGQGDNSATNITIRNNVLHDSYNNDILKINNAARDVLVTGNVFYNQTGSDEHIDINSVEDVTVEDNIFFNDFAGSGRTNNNGTSSFIVVKDSNDTAENGGPDIYTGSRGVTIGRNVFLNYQGSSGTPFLLLGEDGKPYYEVSGALVENNLFLGNSANTMRAAFGVKGCRDATFRNNTVTGNLPSNAFAMRLNREGENLQVDRIFFYNNIWTDPTGTMGDFSDTLAADVLSIALDNNLYWNNGSAIPSSSTDAVNYTDDTARIVSNPLIPNPAGATVPRWVPSSSAFADGSTTIRQAFERLVTLYGKPALSSAARDAADPAQAAARDILGNLRGAAPDVGAFEINASSCSTASTSGTKTRNLAVARQTGTFTVHADLTPSASPMEGGVGLTNDASFAWTGAAAILRFDPGGTLKIRNGGSYTAATSIPYVANGVYHVRMVVSVATHTYSVFVTPLGGSELLLGSNVAFRTEQHSVAELDNWMVRVATGAIQSCNLRIE